MASIATGNSTRDDDRRSANYFQADRYPQMTYSSTGLRADGDEFALDGELTAHGVTRPVPLHLEVNGFGPDPYRGQRCGFIATGSINRSDFGMSFTTRSTAESWSATASRSPSKPKRSYGHPPAPDQRPRPATGVARDTNVGRARNMMGYGIDEIIKGDRRQTPRLRSRVWVGRSRSQHCYHRGRSSARMGRTAS